jgi:hypothetical protein
VGTGLGILPPCRPTSWLERGLILSCMFQQCRPDRPLTTAVTDGAASEGIVEEEEEEGGKPNASSPFPTPPVTYSPSPGNEEKQILTPTTLPAVIRLVTSIAKNKLQLML